MSNTNPFRPNQQTPEVTGGDLSAVEAPIRRAVNNEVDHAVDAIGRTLMADQARLAVGQTVATPEAARVGAVVSNVVPFSPDNPYLGGQNNVQEAA